MIHIGFVKQAAGVHRFFHGTRPTRVRKILREGLRASKEGRGFNSSFLPRGTSLSEFVPGWKPGVSLTTERAHAQVYARAGDATDELLGKVPAKALQKLRARGSLVAVEVPRGHPKLKRVSGADGGMDEWRFEGDIPRGWLKQASAPVVFDFDGVINPYTKGWQGVANIPEPPRPIAVRTIMALKKRKIPMVIQSARANSAKGKKAIEDYLDRHGLPKMRVYAKPHGRAYIDDRGHKHTSWAGTMRAIEAAS